MYVKYTIKPTWFAIVCVLGVGCVGWEGGEGTFIPRVRINVWNPPTLNFRSDWSGTTQVQKFWTYTYLVCLNTNALIITRVWNIYLLMIWMFKKNVPKKAHIFNSETLNDCQFSTYNSPSIGAEPQLTKLICFLVRYTIWTVRLDG